jgi:hypothetical protein
VSDAIERIRTSCPLLGIKLPTLSTSPPEEGSLLGENKSVSTPSYTTDVRQPEAVPSSTCSRTFSLMQITRRDDRYTRCETRRHHSLARPWTCFVEKASRPCTDTTNGTPSSALNSMAA